MVFLVQFVAIYILVVILNLIGEKLFNNKITKKVVTRNLIICAIISLVLTAFFYIQPNM